MLKSRNNSMVINNMYTEIQHVTGYVLDGEDPLANLKESKPLYPSRSYQIDAFVMYSDNGNALDYCIAPAGELSEDAQYHAENDPADADNMEDAKQTYHSLIKDSDYYDRISDKYGYTCYAFNLSYSHKHSLPKATDVLKVFMTQSPKVSHKQYMALLQYAKQQDKAYNKHTTIKPNPYRKAGLIKSQIEANVSSQQVLKDQYTDTKRKHASLVLKFNKYCNSLNK